LFGYVVKDALRRAVSSSSLASANRYREHCRRYHKQPSHNTGPNAMPVTES
jgi:hypothetical protein